MRISKTPNASPDSTPPAGAGRQEGAEEMTGDQVVIWTSLVPRLVHPTKLAIIEALIDAGHPLSLDDLVPLVPAVDGNVELIRYHAKLMVKAGALKVDSVQIKSAAEVPCFYFPFSPRSSERVISSSS